MKKQLKLTFRKVRALLQAGAFRLMAAVGRRGPSRSCQVPELKAILTKCLGDLKDGVFVEVGAYDGEKFSNTSWLADNGWRGIYIEPSPEFAGLCRMRHCLNEVTVVNSAAGESDGEAVFMQMGSLSTMSISTFDAYQNIPWAKSQMESRLEEKTTQVRTLDSILEANSCPAAFDVLVVDVEGFEESVFRSFNLKQWRPRLMIVELCDAHHQLNTNSDLADSARRVRSMILAAGYCEVYKDQINTIFAVPECVSGGSATASKKSAA